MKSTLSNLSNYLHGKKMRIVMDADKTFYYWGRCTINKFKTDRISEDASDGHLKLNTDKLVYYCIKAIQELCEKEGMRYSKPIYKDPYTYLEKKTFIAKMPSQKYLESEPYEREPIILPKRRE